MGLVSKSSQPVASAFSRSPAIACALTAHAMAGDREKALASGCDEFDTKPIEFDRLLTKIEQALVAKGRRQKF